ncbi:MAG TPA: Crp/Fnr family transcriptional regulator [Vicinamibacterales bacterium]
MPGPERRLLGSVPLFAGLDREALDAVAADARTVRAAPGRAFFREGEPAGTFFVLARGRVKFTQVSAEGHEIILRVTGPGEPFGGIAAFVEGGTYPVTARAVEPCEAYAWDGGRVTALMLKFPQVGLNAARLVAERLHTLQRQHRELMTERVERRIAHAILRLAHHSGRRVETGVEIDFPLSRQDLAQMTGTTLFTVSRTLSAWQDEGIITTAHRRIVVRQPHKLVRVAEDLPAPPTER